MTHWRKSKRSKIKSSSVDKIWQLLEDDVLRPLVTLLFDQITAHKDLQVQSAIIGRDRYKIAR